MEIECEIFLFFISCFALRVGSKINPVQTDATLLDIDPFAHPVACCCVLLGFEFETGQTFSRVQIKATLLANNSPNIVRSCCVRLHVTWCKNL